VAIVERFKQESMYGQSAKKMAVVERWSLVEVRLYYRASRNSSDEKKNIELPRHATIAILDATLFLRDQVMKFSTNLPERVVSGRWRHSDPNSPLTNVNKNVAFALLQNHPGQSY